LNVSCSQPALGATAVWAVLMLASSLGKSVSGARPIMSVSCMRRSSSIVLASGTKRTLEPVEVGQPRGPGAEPVRVASEHEPITGAPTT